MDKSDNLKLVRYFGDDIQLEFGNEFGYYAKNLSKDLIYKFCNEVNFNEAIQKSGFMFLTCIDSDNRKLNVIAINRTHDLSITVKLLDNSLYFIANEKEWSLISDKMFSTVQNLWRKFIAKHSLEYQKHLNMLDALEMTESCC